MPADIKEIVEFLIASGRPSMAAAVELLERKNLKLRARLMGYDLVLSKLPEVINVRPDDGNSKAA